MKKCCFCKKKKIGVFAFSCKCGLKKLCSQCRMPESHNCTFDFQKDAKEKLEKKLPLVIPSKLEKIGE